MLRWRALGEVRLAQGAADPHSASLTKCTKGAASVEGMLRTITAWLVTAAVAIGATAFAAMAVGGAVPPGVPGTPGPRAGLPEIPRAVGPTQVWAGAIHGTGHNPRPPAQHPARAH